MLESGFYLMDCMDGMKQFPDKFFDLAIVDPPYGDGGQKIGGGTEDSAARNVYGAARSRQASLNPIIPSRMTAHPTKVISESWRG